ncbi:UNVERIFIED_CONTAM: hypothetical protein FKN15_037340 [Acipenser sinensis]
MICFTILGWKWIIRAVTKGNCSYTTTVREAIKILVQSGKVCEVTERAVKYAENSEDESDDSDASSMDQGSDTGPWLYRLFLRH